MAAATKRKQEKVQAKDRKEHKKSKITSDEPTNVKSKSKKSKPPPPPSPSPPSSEDEEEEEEHDVEMADADESGAWEDDEEAAKDSDIEMEDAGEEDSAEQKSASTKTPEELEKQRLSRAEQKRLAAERKQAKPMGDIIHRSKRIWEQLRRKQSTQEERKKLIDELQSLVRGRIQDLVFKHDASRIVQTALKYGTKAVRQEIAEGLKGTYVELSQSSYGKYLVAKVMHYGTEETRQMVSQEFVGHAKKLIKHREASFVVEDIFREYGSKAQKAQLLREFYGVEFAIFTSDNKDKDDGSLSSILEKHPEKRTVIMKNLLDILTAVVGKGALFFSIVHRAMLEFISNTTSGTTEATEFIELIKEHVGEIGFTKDGAQVVMRCLALGTAKDRKVMTKSLKPVADQLSAHEAGHLILLTAFDVVDDTVLVSKTLFPELQTNLLDLAIHNFGRIPLLYPFTGRTKRLLPPASIKILEQMDELKKATSKKDDDVRRQELRAQMSPIALKGIVEHGETLVLSSFGCTFITEVLLGADGNKTEALTVLADLSATGSPAYSDDPEETHFAATAAGGRMLKTLVLGGHFNTKTKKVDVISPPLNFHSILYPKIKSDIAAWAIGPASFVVVGLLEAEGFPEKGDLKKVLKGHMKALKTAAEGGNKGTNVIINALG